MQKEKLSERKQKILKAVVDSYINTAEPISSANIRENYMQDVSSATIRSELVTLEDMGYLAQPHISAGRIPSSKAYKYYVDALLSEGDKGVSLSDMRSYFDGRVRDLEDVVKSTAKIISDVTNYTSIIVLKDAKDVVIKEVKLVDLLDGTALVIVITDSGVLKDKVVNLKEDMDNAYVVSATKVVNDIFAGKKLGEFDGFEEKIDEEISEFKNLFYEIFDMVESYKKKQTQVYLEGTNKIFEYPEYDNVDNVKNFLSVLNEKDKLRDLVEDTDGIEFSVRIGKEDSDELQNMALVTAKYTVNGKEVGHAGVIGPERMNYKKVLGVLQQIGKTMEIVNDQNDGGKKNGKQ